MSVMRFSEAVESALRQELDARPEVVLLRPGARRTLDAPEQEIPLPRLGSACFDIAVGAALAGMRPVLDLRKEDISWLGDALRARSGSCPPVAVLVSSVQADAMAEGVALLRPRNPRQAVGFLRAALSGRRTSVLIDDPALAPITGDVPEDEDFLLLPAGESEEDWFGEEEAWADAPEEDDEAEAYAEAAEEEAPGEDAGDDEDAFPGEVPEEEESREGEIPADGAFRGEYPEEESLPDGEQASGECALAEPDAPESAPCPEGAGEDENAPGGAEYAPIPTVSGRSALSLRSLPWDFSRLDGMSGELEAPDGHLVALCMERLARGRAPFSWLREESALPGECAFLPPGEESACLWLGRDRLCLTYDGERLPHPEAALLLRAARRLLENPALLIYDKERDPT